MIIETLPLLGQNRGPRPAVWEISDAGWIKRDGLTIGQILPPGPAHAMSYGMGEREWRAFLTDVGAALAMYEQDRRAAAIDAAEVAANRAKLEQRKIAEKHLASPGARRRARKTP